MWLDLCGVMEQVWLDVCGVRWNKCGWMFVVLGGTSVTRCL